MSDMTEITVALPVFLLEDAEEMIDETGFHNGVEDFVTDGSCRDTRASTRPVWTHSSI